jgi:hypothetical protein
MKISSLICVSALGLTFGCGGANEAATDKEPAEQEVVGYSAAVTTNPSPVVVGAPALLDVRVTGSHATPLTHFDLLHTQTMHLIAVSSDLEDFIHVHPALQPAGDLTANATFARPEPYAVFMEYDPAGAAGPTVSRARITPGGSHPAAPQLREADAFGGAVSKTTVATGTAVQLVGAPGGVLEANVAAHLVVRFTNTDGTPVDDLTSWLGMPAHAIVVSPDLETFVHAHGMADDGRGHGADGGHDMGSTTTGPVVIDLTLPAAGLYKMFVQFQRGATVITAPFVLGVTASDGPPPPAPSCATMTCPKGQECMVMGTPPAPMCM